MAEGKWIAGLSPGMSPAEAAAVVLPARLQVVSRYLPLAADSASKDLEHVHQLRVATRRASAALRLFRDCLGDKKHRRLRKPLRALRQAAGNARDWDVFFVMLQANPLFKTASAKPAFDVLVGLTAARRMQAQEELAEVASNRENEFKTELNELSKQFDWQKPDEPKTLGEMGNQNVADLLDEFNAATATPPSDYGALHQVRILGKRLRYTMEIFVDCFEAPFREVLYPAVEEVQETLGNLTDAHVSGERIAELRIHLTAFHRKESGRYKATLDKVVQAQKRIFPRERKRFLNWLKKWKQLSEEYPLAALPAG